MADGIEIKLKRAKTYTANDYRGLPIKDRILLEGEPFYLMDIEPDAEFPGKILVIGDGVSTVEELLASGNCFISSKNTKITIDQLEGFGPSNDSRYPLMNGARATGVSPNWSREDHSHPSDTSKLNVKDGLTNIAYDPVNKIFTRTKNNKTETIVTLAELFASPEFTGNPKVPTAVSGDITNNPTKIANITYVKQQLESKSIVETKRPKTSGTIYVTGVESQDGNLFYNTAGTPGVNGVRIECAKGILKGAAWNDIAEYREGDNFAGHVVCDSEDGSVRMSTKRLQKMPYIVSDTFGFAIGETEKCNVPVAIAGRVLAYANNKSKIHVGDAVCAGKNGNVSRMNRLEQILFPDRIIGYVSEIPHYFTWNKSTYVDNRIWIKIK